MSVSMAKTVKEERLRWVLPIVKQEVTLKDAAKVCPHGKRSLERWMSAYKKYGEEGLEPKSTRPKTNPKEISIQLKEQVYLEPLLVGDIFNIQPLTQHLGGDISMHMMNRRATILYDSLQKSLKHLHTKLKPLKQTTVPYSPTTTLVQTRGVIC